MIDSVTVISFDIDGTLEVGSPPGPISLDAVRSAHALGFIVGTASDRTLREQEDVWERCGVAPHFTGHKHQLDRVRARYQEARFIHIGDTNHDEHYARLFGFEYWDVAALPDASDLGWSLPGGTAA